MRVESTALRFFITGTAADTLEVSCTSRPLTNTV